MSRIIGVSLHKGYKSIPKYVLLSHYAGLTNAIDNANSGGNREHHAAARALHCADVYPTYLLWSMRPFNVLLKTRNGHRSISKLLVIT